jgi:nicotinamidase-related amidase
MDEPDFRYRESAMTLCQADRSTLLIIDLQARLMPAIHDGDGVVRRCVQLATAARALHVPVIGTEENPDGLGPNVAAVRTLCDTTLAKFFFSAVAEPGFLEQLPAGRETLVVAGCEAHVCVMQTVARLLEAGRRVKWVSDAVGSRHGFDRDAATARARALGADIVTTEMVLFEWLETCRHPAFRSVLQLMR